MRVDLLAVSEPPVQNSIDTEQVEDLAGISVLRGGGNARSWNGIRYKQGLSGKNCAAQHLSINVATVPPGATGPASERTEAGVSRAEIAAVGAAIEANAELAAAKAVAPSPVAAVVTPTPNAEPEPTAPEAEPSVPATKDDDA